jgi:hypothetical protein
VIDLFRDIVEVWLPPRTERTPKPAWLLRTKETHIEDTVFVLILEGAQRPTADGNSKMELRNSRRFNADLLNWALEETVPVPQRNIDRMFS